MKIELDRLKTHRDFRQNVLPWASCLPFTVNKRGLLVHRPRAVATVKILGRTHTSAVFWCGTHVNSKSCLSFVAAPDEKAVLCSRCEQAATKAGLESASSIAGRHVHIGGVKVFLECPCESAS